MPGFAIQVIQEDQAVTDKILIYLQGRELACGMNDHIARPIDPEVMSSTMDKWNKPHVCRPCFRYGWEEKGSGEIIALLMVKQTLEDGKISRR